MNVNQRRSVVNLVEAIKRVTVAGLEPRVIPVTEGVFAGRAALIVEDPAPAEGEPCHRTVAIVTLEPPGESQPAEVPAPAPDPLRYLGSTQQREGAPK